MPKLFIPSRNRPSSLSNVLSYLVKFYPKTEIIIADGSNASYNSAYKKIVTHFKNKINIQYFIYDSSLSMAERVIDVLKKIDDEFIIFGSDDDFPVMDFFSKAELFLKDNSDYTLAIGGTVALRILDNNSAQSKLLYSRSIEQNSPNQRIYEFIKWPYATCYSLVRREHVMNGAKHWDYSGMVAFGDFTMGFHNCIDGKIKSFEDICYFSTTNKVHSNKRRKNNLFYIERANDVLATKKHYKDTLLKLPSMSEVNAEKFSLRLVNTRVAELITPALQNTEGFGRSILFNKKEVLGQYRNFKNLFKINSKLREKLLPKLEVVINFMIDLESSRTDNINE